MKKMYAALILCTVFLNGPVMAAGGDNVTIFINGGIGYSGIQADAVSGPHLPPDVRRTSRGDHPRDNCRLISPHCMVSAC